MDGNGSGFNSPFNGFNGLISAKLSGKLLAAAELVEAAFLVVEEEEERL
jgi:hypothetical protein